MENKLKQKRENKGLTQNEIVEQANISIRAYQNYESCKREPKVSTAIKICKALNTTVEKAFPLNDDQS